MQRFSCIKRFWHIFNSHRYTVDPNANSVYHTAVQCICKLFQTYKMLVSTPIKTVLWHCNSLTERGKNNNDRVLREFLLTDTKAMWLLESHVPSCSSGIWISQWSNMKQHRAKGVWRSSINKHTDASNHQAATSTYRLDVISDLKRMSVSPSCTRVKHIHHVAEHIGRN